jgi:hypothetical protein
MPKFELIKSIEVTPLNKRTGIPTSDPPVTIPYGAIVENAEQDRDFEKFTYLGQPYRCPREVFQAAVGTEAPAPAVATAADALPRPADRLCLLWLEVPSSAYTTRRAKVPGGWLVSVSGSAGDGLAFYPDPQHVWNGASLP